MSSTPDPLIGLLSWDYGRPKGGMGRALQQVVAALKSRSSEDFRRRIHVLAPCPSESPDDPLLRFTGLFGGQILFSLLLPFVLHKRIGRKNIGGLLVPVGPGGVLLFRKPSVPVAAIVYHSYFQQFQSVPGQWWKKIFCPFERRTLSFCKMIICYSADTKQALIAAYGVEEKNITVLRHAVTIPSAPDVLRDPLLCVCVARLEARKGVDILLSAWPSIIRQIPEARLVVVGDGVQRRTIDRLIGETMGVERRMHLSQAELDALLAQASIAFCPAYLEGFGLACAEAMAAGCCVIASDADGLQQLITQGESGMLVPAGDCEALAAAAIGALTHAEAVQKIGAQAKDAMRLRHDPVAADAALCDAVRSAFA